jgi:hypothetical protein
MASSPPPPQPLDFNQILGQSATGTTKLAGAIGQANVAGANVGNYNFAEYLDSDGRTSTIDPNRLAELDKGIAKDTRTLKTATKQLTAAEQALKKAEEALAKAQANPNTKPATLAKLQGKVTKAQGNVTTRSERITTLETNISTAQTAKTTEGKSITELYKKADPNTYAALDSARGFAAQIGQTSPQGQKYLDAAGAGYQSRDIGQNNITAAQIGQIADVSSRDIQSAQIGQIADISSRDIQSARLGQIADIRAQQAAAAQARAQQTGVSSLGGQLQQTAAARLALGGRLSEEATRDAIQSARAGMAARGMATGNSALAAELLNRDRYSQARFLENAGFATGVEGQDLSRRLSNTQQVNQISAANMAEANRIAMANQQADLAAQQANQSTAFNREQSNASLAQQATLANQEAALRAATQNQNTSLALGQSNASLAQQAALANQESSLRAATQNQNTSLALGQSNASLAQQAALANQDNTFRTAAFNENNRLTGAQQNLSQLGAASNFVDSQNQAGMNAQIGMASVDTQFNPLFRNLGIGNQYAASGTGTQAVGQATGLAGNVASFNANMAASNYNSYMNNQSALQGANIQAGATAGASRNNTTGMALAGGGAAIGLIGAAVII